MLEKKNAKFYYLSNMRREAEDKMQIEWNDGLSLYTEEQKVTPVLLI